MFLIYFAGTFDASVFLIVAANSLGEKLDLFVIFEMSWLKHIFCVAPL